MGRPLLIVGTGLLAEQVRFYFSRQGGRRVDAHLLDPSYIVEPVFQGCPVLTFEQALQRHPPTSHDLFVAIGHTATAARQRWVEQALAAGYALPSFVHPSAVVADNVRIGVNTLVQELAMVSPFVQLGDNLVICPQVGINHHTRVASHCFFAPQAVVAGDAEIGPRCFIGLGAVIRDRVRIGADCIIGAGAVIMADCPAAGVYPAVRTVRRPDASVP